MPSPRRTYRARLAAVAALVVVLGGFAATTFGAVFVADNGRERAEHAQALKAAAIAAALQRALSHEEDLIVNASAQLALHPTLTSADFAAWAEAVRALYRYPEVNGIIYLQIVTPSELPAYVARITAGTPNAAELAAKYKIAPGQAFGCFTSALVGNRLTGSAPGTDFCASEFGRDVVLMARDRGRSVFVPYELDGQKMVAMETPLYRGGGAPSTAVEREANFIGIAGIAFAPEIVVRAALGDHMDAAVVLSYEDASTSGSFSGGFVAGATTTSTVHVGDGWSLAVSQPKVRGGMLADANARWVLLAGLALSLSLGALVYALGSGRARALRLVAKTTGELRHQALHDPLTGLANRALLHDRVEQLLARGRRNKSAPAALYLDLDGFKAVNDSQGHEVGDRLLQAVAGRLTSAVRGADTIARMGGDEFVILLDGGDLDVAPELVAERLLDVLRQPFELDTADVPVRIAASIGIASGDRPTPDDLIRDADVALYEAKGTGKNRYAVFAPEMEQALRHGIEIEFDLRGALDRDEFVLVYQPIYDLDDLSLTGVEALLRWNHPKLGVVMPDEFIPVLERTGLIVEVGRWVLAEACAQMAMWHRLGSALDMSVNVSARQFDSDSIVEHVGAALGASGLEPASLTIEVTESAVMRNPRASIERLQAIKDLGVRLAIDDFGTGYSSLASLQNLPVDSLKIDRSFISAIADAPESRALVRTIVQLGRDLGLSTLAEGVETAEQVDLLRGDDVHNAQGYLLSRPLDGATIERTILFADRAQHERSID